MWTAPKITSDACFPSPLSLFAHSPFPYSDPGPGPFCCSFWWTLFQDLLAGTYRYCTQAFVVKKKKKKKTCRSAKTKLTCNLWYQARSKAEINAASKLA